jgi:ABC-type methionine transport system ATPase subunit
MTKRASKKTVPTELASLREKRRFWLTIPQKLVKRPIIWEIGHKYPIVTNIGQASVTQEMGIISLEMDGKRSDIKKAIAWLEELHVKVEPVEIGTIEG